MPDHNPVLKEPLPGPNLEYMTRIIRFKKPNDPAGTLGVETLYCKDSVANFLNLKPAPPSDGVFSTNDGNLNAKAQFAKRADKGSKFFKILLLPFTEIDVWEIDPATGTGQKKRYKRSSLGISINGRVGVATVRQWLMFHVGGEGNNDLRRKIKGMITPSLKTYTWRSELKPEQDPPLPNIPIPFYGGTFDPLPVAEPKPGSGGSGT